MLESAPDAKLINLCNFSFKENSMIYNETHLDSVVNSTTLDLQNVINYTPPSIYIYYTSEITTNGLNGNSDGELLES